MREILLAEGLEGISENAFDIFDLEIVVSYFHHLQEGSDNRCVSLCTDRRVSLFLCDAVRDILFNLWVENQGQFVCQLIMSGLKNGDGV